MFESIRFINEKFGNDVGNFIMTILHDTMRVKMAKIY